MKLKQGSPKNLTMIRLFVASFCIFAYSLAHAHCETEVEAYCAAQHGSTNSRCLSIYKNATDRKVDGIVARGEWMSNTVDKIGEEMERKLRMAASDRNAGLSGESNTNFAKLDKCILDSIAANGGPGVPSSATSAWNTFLGATAQAVANRGGKNQSSWQSVSDSLNNGSGASIHSEQITERGAAQITSNSTAPTRSSDPFIYANNVNGCVVIEGNPEGATRARWRNTCGFAINIIFCEINNRRDECAMHMTGSTSLQAYGHDYILDSTLRYKWVACQAPYYIPSTKLTWSGAEFTGRCQANR